MIIYWQNDTIVCAVHRLPATVLEILYPGVPTRKPRVLVDFSLLKNNASFRAVFIARLISVLSPGMLVVAVPVQIEAMTGSALHVALAVAPDGAGMFIGLMCGGVLADRRDRRKLILLARSVALAFLPWR